MSKGCPVEMLTPEKIEVMEKLMLSDRYLKVKETSVLTQISNISVRYVLRDHLRMKKMSARWVPKLLSAIQNQQRVDYYFIF